MEITRGFLTLDLLLLLHEISVVHFRGQPLAILHMINDDFCGGLTVLSMQLRAKILIFLRSYINQKSS